MREYLSILLKWNKSISLTSVVDPLEIITRHVGESIFATCLIPVDNCRLADLGTGAGLPGIPLKIAFPGIHLTLIESNKKKCVFLFEVVRSLGLENVEIIPKRFEDIRITSGISDVITARALGGFSDLLQWSKPALAPRGHMILWIGGEDIVKLTSTRDWIWQPAIKIPESQRRFILIGRPKVEPPL